MIDSVSEFLDKLSANEIRKSIVLFFHYNQFAMDTAANLAKWIKCRSFTDEDVERELNALVELKIVEKMGTDYSAVYFYTQNIEIIHTVDRFLRYLKDKGL